MFNSNMLLSENYRKFTQPSVKVNVEESYFSIATKAIKEMSDCSLEQEKIFLAAVLEAGDSDYLLHESFEQFKENVKKIIDKFLELIKSLAARFLTNMNKIVRSDNYLKKHRKDFDAFTTDDNFKATIFTYTNIDNDVIPRTTAYAELVNFSNAPVISDTVDDPLTSDRLYTSVTSYYDLTKNGMNKWYEKFRARVLGKDGQEYDAAEYKNELFRFFRNDESEKTETDIDREWIVNAFERFANYKKTLSDVTNIKRKLEAEYNKIKSDLEHAKVDDDNMMSKIYPSPEDRTDALMNAYNSDKKRMDKQIDLIDKLKIEKVRNMCSIHAMAFAAKLDAIKDCYKQDKTILYKALSISQKVHESTEVVAEPVYEAAVTEELSYDYDFSMGLVHEAVNQMRLMRCFEEAGALDEGYIPLQESAVDTIKATVQKIIGTLRKVWGKFLGKVSEFVQADKAWLETNKATILNQNWKDRDIEMYIYDEQGLTGDKFKVPQFTYDDFKEIVLSENIESAFIKKYFGTLLDDGEDLRDQIVTKLRSEETKEMSITSLDKRDLYNYCINYENIANNLKKDILVIEKNQSTLNQELGKVEKELLVKQKDEEEAKKMADKQSAQQNQTSSEAEKAQAQGEKEIKDAEKAKEEAKNESAFLSLYEAVVSLQEEGLKIGKTKSDKPTMDNTATKGANINTGARDTGLNQNTAQAGAATQNTNNTENDLKEIEKIKQGTGTYFTCCSNILMAKLTTCQRMYKDYMALLRVHVESYAGEGKKDKKEAK